MSSSISDVPVPRVISHAYMYIKSIKYAKFELRVVPYVQMYFKKYALHDLGLIRVFICDKTNKHADG